MFRLSTISLRQCIIERTRFGLSIPLRRQKVCQWRIYTLSNHQESRANTCPNATLLQHSDGSEDQAGKTPWCLVSTWKSYISMGSIGGLQCFFCICFHFCLSYMISLGNLSIIQSLYVLLACSFGICPQARAQDKRTKHKTCIERSTEYGRCRTE